MNGSMFDGLFDAVKLAFGLLVPLALLGLWKIAEIVIWLFQHVSITFS
jgi:hypothetical protein